MTNTAFDARESASDKVFKVMSILQHYILASDSNLNADVIFGGRLIKRDILEVCERLLDDLLSDVEKLEHLAKPRNPALKEAVQ